MEVGGRPAEGGAVGGNLNTEFWNWGVKGEAAGRKGEAGSRMGVKWGENGICGEKGEGNPGGVNGVVCGRSRGAGMWDFFL